MPAAGASAIVATEDEEALAKTCKEVAKAGTDFVWTQLRSLGTFLGSRAAHKQQQQRAQTLSQQQTVQEQQSQPVAQPSSGAAARPNQCAAAVSNGTADLQGNPNPLQDTQVMLKAFQPDVNGVEAQSGRQPNDHTDANFTSACVANSPGVPSQNETVTKEEAASTTHEHTESHKYVKTERDASGSQQATAEVVQKTTTQICKRKREETSASGNAGNEVHPSQTEAGPVEGSSQQPGPTAQHVTADRHGAGVQTCRL